MGRDVGFKPECLLGFFAVKLVCELLLMAEIRRSPVEVGSLSHYLQGFNQPQLVSQISSINSISGKYGTQKSSTICQRFTGSTFPGLQDLVVAPKGEKILSLLPSFKEGAMFHDLSHGTPGSISLHHFCLKMVELACFFSLCM